MARPPSLLLCTIYKLADSGKYLGKLFGKILDIEIHESRHQTIDGDAHFSSCGGGYSLGGICFGTHLLGIGEVGLAGETEVDGRLEGS